MRMLAVVIVALTLGACAGPPVSVRDILSGTASVGITTTVVNPVGRNELAAVQNAYGAALALAVNYRRHCYPGNVAVQPPPVGCSNRRANVLAIQSADRKAHAAIVSARNFVRNNPTISAFSAIGAARAAVADFQSTAATFGAR